MKSKIQIKTFGGSLLFEYELEDNSLKKTLIEAVNKGADLRGAYLQGADLRGVDLQGAYLQGADLRGVDLQGAYLRGAYLRGVDLRGAKNIPERYFTMVRDDFWAVLCSSPKEVGGLKQAIIDGKIDGTQYEGNCVCLVGTIAKVKGVNYKELETLKADSNRLSELFFMNIEKGDTPKTNEFSKKVLGWLEEWETNMKEACSK